MTPSFSVGREVFFEKSVIRISREEGVLRIKLHKSNLRRQKFGGWLSRILAVLEGYSRGVDGILDYSKKSAGREEFFLDLSDGGTNYWREIVPGDNFYAFSRQKGYDGIGLIPDPYNLSDIKNGYSGVAWENHDQARSDYENRVTKIFWRGSSTGRQARGNLDSNARIRFCIEALEHAQSVDAKISQVVQFPSNKAAFRELSRRGVMAAPVAEAEFSRYKATVDLDGNSAAWGVLRKHLFGLNVIKPASPFEMFHDVMQPADSFTFVESTTKLFEGLKSGALAVDDFETAWQGYLFAHETRKKIIAGHATVFPC